MKPETIILSAILLMIIIDWYNKYYNKRKDGVGVIWKFPIIKDGIPTKYGWVVRHTEKFFMNDNTDIGFGTYINAKNGVWIGENVKIGAHCSVYSENTEDNTGGNITIHKNVKIGSGTVILPRKDGQPLVIGKNSRIGALSLVKDSIPENCIAYGVPAKVCQLG